MNKNQILWEKFAYDEYRNQIEKRMVPFSMVRTLCTIWLAGLARFTYVRSMKIALKLTRYMRRAPVKLEFNFSHDKAYQTLKLEDVPGIEKV